MTYTIERPPTATVRRTMHPRPAIQEARPVTPTDEAAGKARAAFQRIIAADQSKRQGWQEREDAIMAMVDAGMSHRDIAEALRGEAEAAGYTPEQVKALGISEGNVFTVIRTAKARRNGQ